MHEIGHLVLDHRDSGWRSEELQKALFPGLDARTIRSMLCRSGYSDAYEEEAEEFADLVLAPRVLTPGSYTVPVSEPPGEIAHVLKNIERVWGPRAGGLA